MLRSLSFSDILQGVVFEIVLKRIALEAHFGFDNFGFKSH